ncbi:methyltransferase domain-containing protein [Streptomyces sp. SID4985]|uniref:putative RNA methyltransferase n=1 Tax=Streptomyces sp. SID4985 TaxID=2690292 RepID=UPI00136B14F3|nr:methyltransferase domain-containing protein [Streptomyces sp. SID4985]MYQ46671.1 methyltransferase domain-containing protein [Streptomyces sp. SID4985]
MPASPSPSPALDSVLGLLRCPVCRVPSLRRERSVLRCPAGHAFDIARHGYAGLLTGARATSGDDTAMVRARERFLAGGRYAPVRDAVAGLAVDSGSAGTGGAVLDAGCGTGYYLAGALDRLPAARGLGLDSSVRALRTAARAHERAAAAAWDVFRPFPLADRVADVVLDVFAPRNPAEFHRVLRPGGRLIVARPTGRHLAELRAPVAVDPAKEERLGRAMEPFFTATVTERVEYVLSLPPADARDLLDMTPTARHLGPSEAALPRQVTVSVLATAYRPR